MKTNTTKSYYELGIPISFSKGTIVTCDEITNEAIEQMYKQLLRSDMKISFQVVRRTPWYKKLYNKTISKHK